ncbi:pentapeptide repeat-containing protein [Dactylosporangium sucinum]|uniref:pentapeptide repeat-containing protein n=1 Tax=Dactylosporangium sucinum TaxID=1424081 RepID=UPI001E616E7C|nr:pentapeptide repeat-containing protein [Dactylosporangium sucinum]
MPPTRIVLAAAAVLAAVLLPVAPAAAEPPGKPACPETSPQLAGKHFQPGEEVGDVTCANLRGAVLDGVDLTQADFTGADLQGASLRGADLTQADLTGADLRGAHLDDADLTQADLSGSDARGASFRGADLGQADLVGADLREADFITASVIQADFTDADLRGAQTWWTLSIQAGVSGTKVDLFDPRTPQAGWLYMLAGLAVLVRTVVRRKGGGSTTGTVMSAVGFLFIGGFTWVFGWMLFAMQFVTVLVPLLVGAALVAAAGVVRQLRPSRDPEPFLVVPPLTR